MIGKMMTNAWIQEGVDLLDKHIWKCALYSLKIKTLIKNNDNLQNHIPTFDF